jgi:hypothetical protein
MKGDNAAKQVAINEQNGQRVERLLGRVYS